MLDRWEYAWDKLNELTVDDSSDDFIDEEEMERRLDQGQSFGNYKELIEYAEELEYIIKVPKF